MAGMANQVPRVQRKTINDFTEAYGTKGRTGAGTIVNPFVNSEKVEFVKAGQDGENTARIAQTCLVKCNEVDVSEAQSCAYFLSGLVALFPTLEPIAKGTLLGMGFRSKDILPTEFEELDFELEDEIGAANVIVMIGQAILILYKNINQQSYYNFMTNRTNALKNLVGVNESVYFEGVDVIFSLDKAAMLRVKLGSQHNLKKHLLMSMLNTRATATPVGEMCGYVCGMLTWNEMTTILFIFQALCQTKSPVLRHPSVAEEVLNLYIAFKKVIDSDYPQYFRIMNQYHVNRCIEKSKFPTLARVAHEVRMRQADTTRQALTTGGDEPDPRVTALVNMHINYINATNRMDAAEGVRFMYGEDAMDVVDENAAAAGNEEVLV